MLCSSVSQSAVGSEFNVNESTIWYHQKKGEGICCSVHEATQSAQLTSVVNGEAMEKVGKWPNVWIHKMMTNEMNSGQHCCEAEIPKEIYSHIAWRQENAKHGSELILAGLCISKGDTA